MFDALGRPPKFWHLTPAGGIRLARLLELLGSNLLYAYEVEWLLSDRLRPAPDGGLDRPFTEVGPYLLDPAPPPRGSRGARPRWAHPSRPRRRRAVGGSLAA